MNHQVFAKYIPYVIKAHQENVNRHGKTHRHLLTGETNPYFTHPLWCASMVLCEPHLPQDLREKYALVLLFHDVVEDTNSPLPKDLPPEVKGLIAKMTVPKLPEYNYSGWDKEKTYILQEPVEIQLLKLYDKTASLYDLAVRRDRYPKWMNIVTKLATNVTKKYGPLHIVTLARSLVRSLKLNRLTQ